VNALGLIHGVTLPFALEGPLAAAGGTGEVAEKLGVIGLAVLVALAVLGRPPAVPRHVRAWAMLGALVLTPVLLAVDVWHTSQLTHLRNRPLEAALACAGALVVVLVLALLVRRRPAAFPLLAILALPFRLPISTGGGTSNLLIPLYLVVAGGALAHVAADLAAPRGIDAGAREQPANDGGTSAARSERGQRQPATERLSFEQLFSARTLEWILVGAVLVYTLQAAYSSDFSKALQNVVFFYAPFALLFALLRDVRWTETLLLRCLGVAVALAVLFVGIGFIEYARQELFLNPKLVQANQYGNYFRVNSVFFDPNIYGRFLALVMIAVTVAVLSARRARDVALGAAVLLWLWGGLVTSFSESSMAALLLGLAVVAAWRWDTLTTIYVTLAVAVVALAVALAAPPSAHFGLSGEGGSANNATSGRASLVSGGLSLFADRPLAGFGAGSFALEYRRHHVSTEETAVSASHTIPVTVAAEQGIVGLAVYVALLVCAFGVLFKGIGRSPPRVAIAACFAALVLHTWAYADFLEDPETWTLLGIGVALAAAGSGIPARAANAAARARGRTISRPRLARL
jgi:O-antigen ligase